MDMDADVLPCAEGAADPAEVQAHVLDGQSEAGRDLVAVVVQPLRRHPQVDAALAVGHGEAGLRPEEGLVLHTDLVGPLDDDVAGRVEVAVPDRHVAHDVPVGMDRIGGLRPRAVHQRLEHLVAGDDGVERPPRRVGMVGGDDGDGFADVADDVGGEHRLVGGADPVHRRAGNVGGRQRAGDAGDGERGSDVELEQAGVRMRRPQRPAVEHALGVQVGREVELALHLRLAVGASRAVPDATATGPDSRVDRRHHDSAAVAASVRRRMTWCTASRMRP